MTEPSTDQNWLDELDSGLLHDSVQQIRARDVPDDAVEHALDRAKSLAAVGAAVQQSPASVKRRFVPSKVALPKFGPRAFAALACVLLLVASLALSSIQSAREAARRMSTSNSFKQIGLGTHSYHSAYRELSGGTALRYELFPPNADRRYGHFVTTDQQPVRFATSAVGDSGRAAMVAHSAKLVLVVDDRSMTESKLKQLINQHQGLIGNSEIVAESGESRSGTWVVRIPADAREAFLDSVEELGVLQTRTTNSSDVTEEYVDVKSRIENKRKLEQRILTLLDKHVGDIKDVITVEEQLARVRQEIESMEGRVKHLDSVTSMTTVVITAHEKRGYVPPTSPTFTSEMRTMFTDSVSVIANLAKSLVLVLIAILPWTPLIAILAYLGRRIRYRSSTAPNP